MRLKKLRKKIERLEERLRQGPAKLAKLKQRLHEAESAKGLKAARKSAARATSAHPTGKLPLSSGANKPSSTKKIKKTRNLSPERRAQLSAAMKARWTARRAAEASATTASSDDQHAAPESGSEPEQSRPDGV